MRNPETNKGTMKMTTKKLLTVFTALLLAVLPIHGLTAANANGVDTSLATFTIEGSDVEDGDVIIVPAGTTNVTVVATPTDPAASVVVTKPNPLQTFDNDVVVEVTGSNGITKQTYTVNVYVTDKAPGFSTDATLGSLRVNGATINPGDVVEVAPLTSAVTVAVTPNDVAATSVVSGARNLSTGMNTVSVVITAEDGVTTRSYTFKVLVLALSSNVSLETFSVNGQAVRNGGRIFLEPGTTAVTAVATPVDPTSSVQVNGSTGLQAGENTLTATVTSQSGATATYTVKLIVQVPSSISSLVVFKVSGARVVDGSTVLLPAGTEAVAVTAIPSDATASVNITGNSGLVVGDNNLSVVVTAEDGSTSTYAVTLRVLKDDDTSLAVFQYDGSDVADGDSFDLEYGTESVEIVAEATSATSTVEIVGASALLTGRNVVRINVTAQDESVRTYRLIFNVAKNTDTSLESVSVSGQDATGGSVTVPAGTRAVSVSAVTTDPYATYEVKDNTSLEAGDNTVTITVTAQDGETTEDIEITVTVLQVVLNDDAGLESLNVAGKDVAAGGSVDAPFGTRGVVVKVLTSDPFATFEVSGNDELVPGENTITVTVTAADGETTEEYSVTVVIPELSDDSSVALFQINGQDVEDGAQLNLPYGTKSVNVKVETTDANASFAISGDGKVAPLVVGDQDLVVTVTAANGDSTDYTVTLTVLPLSENANLDADAGLVVNGESVDFELLNSEGYFNVPLSTTTVSVKVQAEDYTSDVFVNTKTVLPGVARNFSVDQGVNNLSIKVVPQAGEAFAKTYVLKVYVGGADATLKTVRVNTTNITFNESNEGGLVNPLANGTQTATLFVDPTVALAVGAGVGTKLDFDGGDATVTKAAAANTWNVSGLVTGDNPITITVTPGDSNAEQVTYTVNIPVDLSSDAGLKTFKINGVVYPVGSTQVLALGTTEVEIDGETNSDVATFEVSGGDALVPGLNTLTITVTAEKGNTADYKVTAIVPRGKEVAVVGFPKVGVVTIDAKTNKAGNAALTALVKKLTTLKANVVSVTITNNFLIAKDKPAAGTARATAVQKFLQAAKVNGVKTAKYQLLPGLKTQKGTTITVVYW